MEEQKSSFLCVHSDAAEARELDSMLTLSQSRQIGPLTIYRDFALIDGRVSYTRAFYVLPSEPRFSLEDGDPAFRFVWFRSAVPDVTKAGGIVTITVEVSIPADQRDGLRQTIASTYSLAASDVELRSVPFKAGSAGVISSS